MVTDLHSIARFVRSGLFGAHTRIFPIRPNCFVARVNLAFGAFVCLLSRFREIETVSTN
jgi:hypothetical protein